MTQPIKDILAEIAAHRKASEPSAEETAALERDNAKWVEVWNIIHDQVHAANNLLRGHLSCKFNTQESLGAHSGYVSINGPTYPVMHCSIALGEAPDYPLTFECQRPYESFKGEIESTHLGLTQHLARMLRVYLPKDVLPVRSDDMDDF